MKTVFPQTPAKDFNDWISYIRLETLKSKGVNPNPEPNILETQATKP